MALQAEKKLVYACRAPFPCLMCSPMDATLSSRFRKAFMSLFICLKKECYTEGDRTVGQFISSSTRGSAPVTPALTLTSCPAPGRLDGFLVSASLSISRKSLFHLLC